MDSENDNVDNMLYLRKTMVKKVNMQLNVLYFLDDGAVSSEDTPKERTLDKPDAEKVSSDEEGKYVIKCYIFFR